MIPDGIDIGPHRVKQGMDIILSGAIGDPPLPLWDNDLV